MCTLPALRWKAAPQRDRKRWWSACPAAPSAPHRPTAPLWHHPFSSQEENKGGGNLIKTLNPGTMNIWDLWDERRGDLEWSGGGLGLKGKWDMGGKGWWNHSLVSPPGWTWGCEGSVFETVSNPQASRAHSCWLKRSRSCEETRRRLVKQHFSLKSTIILT